MARVGVCGPLTGYGDGIGLPRVLGEAEDGLYSPPMEDPSPASALPAGIKRFPVGGLSVHICSGSQPAGDHNHPQVLIVHDASSLSRPCYDLDSE